MTELEYSDLIVGPRGDGIPWVANGTDPAVGLDCKGLAFLVLQRAGIPIRPEALLIRKPGAVLAPPWSAHAPTFWDEVGTEAKDAQRLGDLLVSETAEGLHVMPYVDTAQRLALSIERGRRGVRALRVDLLPPLSAVLRYRQP